jgi:dihydroorotate dehydrogenase
MFGRTLDLVKRYRKLLDAQSLKGTTSSSASAVVPAIDGASPGTGPDALLEPPRKVIFATGGITTGQQALDILNAGASVAMVYTGLVYGGAGTITRLKEEMKAAL